jgi:uncharacterized protein YcfJ
MKGDANLKENCTQVFRQVCRRFPIQESNPTPVTECKDVEVTQCFNVDANGNRIRSLDKAAIGRGCPFSKFIFSKNSINSDNFSNNYDKFR